MNEDLLQTIKDQVSQELFFNPWESMTDHGKNKLWPEVCKRYAQEVAKTSLKKASENATAFIDENLKGDVFAVIVKSSIDNESNIVL